MIRGMKRCLLIGYIFVIISVVFLCGCSQLGITTNSISGHVYMDGHAVSGASVEAVSVNGTSRVNTSTDNDGAYTLNINPDTKYNLTTMWQGRRHTVWPVSIPGDVTTYDINLTSMPTSTIEGGGYETGTPDPEKFGHKRVSGMKIGVTPIHGNTSITTYTDINGNYILNVEPNVNYNIIVGDDTPNYFTPIFFNYRNSGSLYGRNITVGSNETVLVDYVIPVP